MRKLYLLFLILVISITQQQFAQNQINGNITNDWVIYSSMTASAGTSFIYTYISDATSAKYFRLKTSVNGQPDYFHGVNDNDVLLAIGTGYDLNVQSYDYAKAYYINAINSYNYIFKTNNGNGATSPKLVIFEVQGTVRTFVGITEPNSGNPIYPGQEVNITVTLNGDLNPGQKVYLRYAKNGNWATSSVLDFTTSLGSGNYLFKIPSSVNDASSTISYYVFTSGNDKPSGSNADWYTINLLNNSGGNYSYTVKPYWVSQSDGNWSTGANWVSGNSPTSADNVIVKISNNITMDASVTLKAITIDATKIFTIQNGNGYTLNIAPGGSIINNGTFTLNDSKISFSGNATVTTGTALNYYDVSISGGVDLGSNPNINNSLTINTGGWISTNIPIYSDNATLIYNPNGSYTISNEWGNGTTVGSGVPKNITIGTTNITSFNFGSIDKSRNVPGNLIIGSGSSLTLSSTSGGDINIGGNFSNNGNLICNSGAVAFNGSSAQTISSSNPLSIDYLTINNTNGDVTLSNNNMTVNNNLTFTSGNLKVTSPYVVTIGTSSSLVNESPSHYLIGDVKLNSVTNLSSGTYLGLTTDAIMTGNGIVIKRTTGAAQTGDSHSGINRYWTLTPTSGNINYSGNITLSWYEIENNSKSTSNAIIFENYPGAEHWVFLNNTLGEPITNNSGVYTLASSVPAALSNVSSAIYTISDAATPLPVELTAFSGRATKEGVTLNWNTATEISNNGFDIERSLDKNNWQKIAFVKGNGNSNSPKDYTYTDNYSFNGSCYYRLKQIDTDGKFTYSKVIEIKGTGNVSDFNLAQNYPNPFNPCTNINFSLNESGKAKLVVYDILGKERAVLFNGNVEAGKNYNVSFNGSNLESGVYFYKLTSGSVTSVKKMMLVK